jgi:hypothetical protein
MQHDFTGDRDLLIGAGPILSEHPARSRLSGDARHRLCLGRSRTLSISRNAGRKLAEAPEPSQSTQSISRSRQAQRRAITGPDLPHDDVSALFREMVP